MKHYITIAFLLAFVMTLTTQAEEQKQMRVKIAVEKSGGDDTHFDFDSEKAGFDLDKMQIGESQTITDDSGKAALVTRTENGFQFDVDGEKIDVLDHPTLHEGTVIERRPGAHGDAHVIRKVRKIELEEGHEDVFIIDEYAPQDDATVHRKEQHKVYVIKKEIEVDVAN